MTDILPVVLAGLLGLAFGSFLNAAIYRLPRDIKLRKGRSRCPECQEPLKWFHNVPVLAYLFLRGKCAFCGSKIPIRYPIVELVNAALYVYLFVEYGPTLEFVIFAYLFSALLTITLIDYDHRIIPDVITLPGIVLGLAVSLLPDGMGILQSGIGLLVGGGSLYLIAMLGDWLFKKESMGGGDIKLAAMLGAFLGWQKILFVFICSAGIGLAISLLLMIVSSRLRQERTIPFGPFLAIAAALAILWGDQLIRLYVETFLPAS